MDRKLSFVALIGFAALLAGCGGGQIGAKPPSQPTTTTEAAKTTQVTLESPQAGTVPNPVTVQATASTSTGVTGWIVYVDNQIAYQASNNLTSLSTPVTLPAGSHTLYVRAWDQTGAYGTSPTLQVSVSGASAAAAPVSAAPAPSGPLPAPPASAEVLDHLQDTTDNWESCSSCAGGSTTTTNFWTAPFQSSPSISGSSREFFAGGLGWSNVLWIKKLPPHNQATHFIWDFWAYFDDTSAAKAWTAEYDFWLAIGGQEFMVGSQCDFGDGYWDTFDSKNNKWITTSIPCKRFTGSTWHHIQWYIERISSYQYRYDTLVVDGHPEQLNQVFEVNPINWPDSMGVQWQLDQDASGTPLHEWIDNVKLTSW